MELDNIEQVGFTSDALLEIKTNALAKAYPKHGAKMQDRFDSSVILLPRDSKQGRVLFVAILAPELRKDHLRIHNAVLGALAEETKGQLAVAEEALQSTIRFIEDVEKKLLRF